MNKKLLLFFSLFLAFLTTSFAQSSRSAELVSHRTFGEGLMVTKAKIPPVSGLVSNMFFFNRVDTPWNGNVWYEYDWEIRGAHPNNGWSQIRVRPQAGGQLKNAPINSAATTHIGNSLLHWILIRKGNDYIYDIRKDFDINNYNYNNAAAHGGNSVSLLVGGPRVYTTGGAVAHIPAGKQLDFSLGLTAFDNNWSGPLPDGAYSADFVIDFTRFYSFSGNNLNTSPQWQDEFNFLDFGKWQIANWTFGDTQFAQSNIRFEDGKMILTANRTNGAGGNSNTNLALNGTASQSTTASGGSASRAIDNNTNGNWGGSSVTHTASRTNSWWQVDLGQDADLDKIQIFNRVNCCLDRLSNFSVSVLDANNKVVWTRFYSNPPSPSLTINLDAIGRKVRVNLDGILSLAEVKVFGTGGNTSTTSNKVVHLRKRNASNFAMDGKGGATNGQNIHLWTQNAGNVNQQWIEVDRGGGFYSYQKQGTNHCIDGGNGGARNQNVGIFECQESNQNQHWQKIDKGSGHFQLKKRNAAYVIDGGSGGSKGQNVKLWSSSTNHQNTHWQISEIPNVTASSRTTNEAITTNYIHAQKSNRQQVALTWLVDNQKQPVQYEIEYKNTSGAYEVLGVVAANASDNSVQHFIHESPIIGENNYRIKVISVDYSTEYLEPQTIFFDANDMADNDMIFPNPSKGALFVDLSDYSEEKINIVLTDLSGKVYMTKNLDSNHSSLLNLNISSFQNGLYMLYIKGDNKQMVTKKISLIQTY